ncbi:hypothetical protein BA897_00085 [Spiribacter roseus]|nr:hypothetical protein BA897_00085 [Spiribacter roseus]
MKAYCLSVEISDDGDDAGEAARMNWAGLPVIDIPIAKIAWRIVPQFQTSGGEILRSDRMLGEIERLGVAPELGELLPGPAVILGRCTVEADLMIAPGNAAGVLTPPAIPADAGFIDLDTECSIRRALAAFWTRGAVPTRCH